jgi:hypothetical protein
MQEHHVDSYCSLRDTIALKGIFSSDQGGEESLDSHSNEPETVSAPKAGVDSLVSYVRDKPLLAPGRS